MFGVNPAMISYVMKSKLDEILNGQCPEGFKLIEKTKKQIILEVEKPEGFDDITLNKFDASIIYKGVEIKCYYNGNK